MIKRIVAVIVMLVMLIGGQNVYAATGCKYISHSEDVIIVPFWDNTQRVTPTISFSDSKYSGTISGNSNVTKITMTIVLSEKNSNGVYSEVSRTSSTANTNVITKSNSYSYVKGKTYKLTVIGQVYVGSNYETVENSIIATY